MRMPISRPAEIIPIIISDCSVDEGPVEPTREREREREKEKKKLKEGKSSRQEEDREERREDTE